MPKITCTYSAIIIYTLFCTGTSKYSRIQRIQPRETAELGRNCSLPVIFPCFTFFFLNSFPQFFVLVYFAQCQSPYFLFSAWSSFFFFVADCSVFLFFFQWALQFTRRYHTHFNARTKKHKVSDGALLWIWICIQKQTQPLSKWMTAVIWMHNSLCMHVDRNAAKCCSALCLFFVVVVVVARNLNKIKVIWIVFTSF